MENKRKKRTVAPPPRGMWRTLENNELKKQRHYILHTNRVRLRTKGNSNRQTKAQKNTLQVLVAPAVCGTCSIDSQIRPTINMSVWYLATLSAVSVLHSSTMPHPRRGCVRQYQTSKPGSSSTHATRLFFFLAPRRGGRNPCAQQASYFSINSFRVTVRTRLVRFFHLSRACLWPTSKEWFTPRTASTAVGDIFHKDRKK